MPCSALLITLVITCACGGRIPSKPSPPLSSLVPGDATRYGPQCFNRPFFGCLRAIETRAWIRSNVQIEQLRDSFLDSRRGSLDDRTSIPRLTASVGALVNVNASDAVFQSTYTCVLGLV